MLQIGILLPLYRLKSYLFQHLISVRLLLWRIGEPNFKGQLLGIIEDNFFLTIYYLGTFFPLDQAKPDADQLILKTWLNLWCLNPVFDRLIAYSCLLSILLDSYEIKAQQDYSSK